MRIGIGIDVHPFAEHRRLVLGGVTIPHERGLAGHSDADALTHAVCDAILGALGEGDIGTHFPDTEPAYKDISSITLLEQVVELMHSQGYSVVNVDSTVICEEPRMAPFIPAMKENYSRHLGEGAVINIKATRNEKMGFIGRKEGVACIAVALLDEKE